MQTGKLTIVTSCISTASTRTSLTPHSHLRIPQRVVHNAGSRDYFMQSTASLFRLLNEFIVLLLGALLVLLATSHRVALPARTGMWVGLGAALILWGLRTGMRPEPKSSSEHAAIRGGSLILVGLMIIAVPLVPMHYEPLLLALAGGVLVLRGLLGSVLLVRTSS